MKRQASRAHRPSHYYQSIPIDSCNTLSSKVPVRSPSMVRVESVEAATLRASDPRLHQTLYRPTCSRCSSP